MTQTFSHDALNLPPLVTLDQAKVHLRLTGTAYDADVQQKLDAAQADIIEFLGAAADATWTAATVPKKVTSAIRLRLGYLYAERGDGTTPDVWPQIWQVLGTRRDPVVA